MPGPRHRIEQVLRHLTARPRPEDQAWAREVLGPEAAPLFDAMDRPDQAHALRVARSFAELGPPTWALQGALLHDSGKPAGFGLAARIAVVLAPGAEVPSDPLASTGLRRIRQIGRWHGLYGARAAERAGLSREAVAFICHHQDPDRAEGIPWLREFQAIDDD